MDSFAKHLIYFASSGLLIAFAILAMMGKVPEYWFIISLIGFFVCRIIFLKN